MARTVYADEVKDGVKLALLQGEPQRSVAERFGVPSGTVAVWASKWKRAGVEFPAVNAAQKPLRVHLNASERSALDRHAAALETSAEDFGRRLIVAAVGG